MINGSRGKQRDYHNICELLTVQAQINAEGIQYSYKHSYKDVTDFNSLTSCQECACETDLLALVYQ